MNESRPRLPDLLTVIAIAVVAYAAANILHEGIGHGGACVILGGEPQVLSSVHFECGKDAMGRAAQKGVSAAGTIVNFGFGVIALIAFRSTDPRRSPHRAYFLWLFTTLNFLMGAGYFLFSGVGNIGDWAAVAAGLCPARVWRPLMAMLGGGLYFLLARQSARWLRSLVGNDELTMKRGRRLTWPAYFAGGTLYCVSGLFNPIGPILIAISAAAASFGGGSGLLWLSQFLRGGEWLTEAAQLNRNWGWVVAGCVATIIFVVILGPSVRL